jgi:hypothetical protein
VVKSEWLLVELEVVKSEWLQVQELGCLLDVTLVLWSVQWPVVSRRCWPHQILERESYE